MTRQFHLKVVVLAYYGCDPEGEGHHNCIRLQMFGKNVLESAREEGTYYVMLVP